MTWHLQTFALQGRARKWRGRSNKYLHGSDFYARQDDHHEANKVLRKVCEDIAKHRSRDPNELVQKACLVAVYEGSYYSIMSKGIALDVALMGVNGRLMAGTPSSF